MSERSEREGQSMRIVVDRDLCDGHGMCEAMAHEFFELDDDDVMTVLDENPPESDDALLSSTRVLVAL